MLCPPLCVTSKEQAGWEGLAEKGWKEGEERVFPQSAAVSLSLCLLSCPPQMMERRPWGRGRDRSSSPKVTELRSIRLSTQAQVICL